MFESHKLILNLFYKFLQESLKWNFQPLITREVFEKAREQLKRSEIKNENKEFAFSKLITCGLCGSSICADEKWKKLANGGVAHYIYYGCNRSKDLQCKCGYIREEELIKQIVGIIDQLDLKESEVLKKYKNEMLRLHKFQKTIMGVKDKVESDKELDIKLYAKYILENGDVHEKRDFLASVDSQILLTHKILTIKH